MLYSLHHQVAAVVVRLVAPHVHVLYMWLQV